MPRDQAYYNKGRELYASKEYEAARQAFQKVRFPTIVKRDKHPGSSHLASACYTNISIKLYCKVGSWIRVLTNF